MDYPKILYLDGACTDEQALAVDGEGIPLNARVVQDAEGEASANADGYFSIGKALAAADQAAGSKVTELDELREKATAAGIEWKGNWGVKKLREALLPEA